MTNYVPTAIADVLRHVVGLKAEAGLKAAELKAYGQTLVFGSAEERWNDMSRRAIEGELLALARVEGYLEARLQIDEIYGTKTIREILEDNLQYDLGE